MFTELTEPWESSHLESQSGRNHEKAQMHSYLRWLLLGRQLTMVLIKN